MKKTRWVKLAQIIAWDELAGGDHQSLSKTMGRRAKDARLVIGAVIIKHKLCLSDRETVLQIQQNPYLQYFVGLAGYQMKAPFAPSLLVDIRKRMGQQVFELFQQSIIDELATHNSQKARASARQDKKDDDNPGAGGSEKQAEPNIDAQAYPPWQGH